LLSDKGIIKAEPYASYNAFIKLLSYETKNILSKTNFFKIFLAISNKNITLQLYIIIYKL